MYHVRSGSPAVVFALALISHVLFAQQPARAVPAAHTAAGARQFVQEFLDWYVPIRTTTSRDAEVEAMNRQPPMLSAELIAALRGDSIARSDTTESREWLDADPFDGTQDWCSGYALEAISAEAVGADFRVGVTSRCRGVRVPGPPRPIALYFVEWRAGHWELADVDFGDYTLRWELCRFAKADSRLERRPTICNAPISAERDTTLQVRMYVADFYDSHLAMSAWYGKDDWSRMLAGVDSSLAAALRADSAGLMQTRASFDPFQLIPKCYYYEVSPAKRRGTGFEVRIESQCTGQRGQPPRSGPMMVDVVREGAAWKIHNARVDTTDLKSILRRRVH